MIQWGLFGPVDLRTRSDLIIVKNVARALALGQIALRPFYFHLQTGCFITAGIVHRNGQYIVRKNRRWSAANGLQSEAKMKD